MPVKMENGGNARYYPPNENILREKSNRLIASFYRFAEINGLSANDICIQRALLPRIVLRVDKRECYFTIFHDNTHIREVKQAALSAYWILKFRPFMVSSKSPRLQSECEDINEAFAYFYILSTCKKVAHKNGIITKGTLSGELRKEVMYAFKYWDLSKESVILIAETIERAFCGTLADKLEK